MDLTLFFSPIDESVLSSITSTSSVLKNIKIYGDKMPDYRGAHVAIIGVNETRGAGILSP